MSNHAAGNWLLALTTGRGKIQMTRQPTYKKDNWDRGGRVAKLSAGVEVSSLEVL